MALCLCLTWLVDMCQWLLGCSAEQQHTEDTAVMFSSGWLVDRVSSGSWGTCAAQQHLAVRLCVLAAENTRVSVSGQCALVGADGNDLILWTTDFMIQQPLARAEVVGTAAIAARQPQLLQLTSCNKCRCCCGAAIDVESVNDVIVLV